MKKNPITFVTAAVLAVIFGLMLFTFQVRQTEIAVLTTFDKYSRSINEPGFNWRLPWPIQKVYRFDNRVQNFERKFEQTTTRDGINVLITVFAGWQIADPRNFLESFSGDSLKAEQALEPLVRTMKTGVLGQHAFGDLISTNTSDLKFDLIEEEMLANIKDQARKNYGIDVRFVRIKQLGLPESITTKVFSRMKAERQTQVTRFLSEGEREAKITRARADSTANQILSDARASAIQITGQAEAKASEYYKVLQQNPELANFLFQRNALEASLKDRTTLILDQQTPPFNMLGGVVKPAASKAQ
jgi:membrane protease subunit HflC